MLESLLPGFIAIIFMFAILCILLSIDYSFLEKLGIPWWAQLFLLMFIFSAVPTVFRGLQMIYSSLLKLEKSVISQIPMFIMANQLWVGVSVICMALLFSFVKWKKSITDQKGRKIREESRVVQNLIDTLTNRWERWE